MAFMIGCNTKACGPKLVTYLNRTLIFEWWVVRCISKKGNQKGMCFKAIGLCAQNFDNHFRFNIRHDWRAKRGGGGLYVTFLRFNASGL